MIYRILICTAMFGFSKNIYGNRRGINLDMELATSKGA